MNDSIYEEYMRRVLGYQPVNTDIYDMNDINWERNNFNSVNSMQMQELEECYPDIYKIVYPMIQKACAQNASTITKELINSMTEEIYSALEDREIIENRDKDAKTVSKSTEKTENRQIIFRNTGLNDLIRILLLRELLGRPGFPGGRPPRPRPPMRPPMGPHPRPQPRHGMGTFNREFLGQYEDVYEY